MGSSLPLVWRIRRRIVAHLESAPLEKKAGLRAALRGIDLLLRTGIDSRRHGATIGGAGNGTTNRRRETWQFIQTR